MNVGAAGPRGGVGVRGRERRGKGREYVSRYWKIAAVNVLLMVYKKRRSFRERTEGYGRQMVIHR